MNCKKLYISISLFVSTFIQIIVTPTHGWMFAAKNSDSDTDSDHIDDNVKIVVPSNTKVPFEIKSTDDNFLLQAQITKAMSQLDACHHLVVMEIETTCSTLSEEEIGKLSVRLLNCQAESEGRKVFPCTKLMTIKECTQDMDPVMWNAYQIVSNRARAICYQTRQQQFRMKTEHTVNQLMYSAQFQLQAMGELQSSQSELLVTAKDSLSQIKTDQENLLSGQDVLRQQQMSLQSSMAESLKDLYNEKALIASGHKAFSDMTNDIKNKLDTATEMLSEQDKVRQENHQEIVQDLASIQAQAKNVWETLENGHKKAAEFEAQSSRHHADTLQNLETINSTVNYIVTLLNSTKHSLDSKLSTIFGLMGVNDNRIEFLIVLSQHTVYLLLAAVTASFLQTPFFTRLMLLTLVPINAFSQLKRGTSLGFMGMTLFIFLCTSANWVIGWMYYLMLFRPKNAPLQITYSEGETNQKAGDGDVMENNNHKGLTQEEIQKLVDILQKLQDNDHHSRLPSGDIPTPTDSIPEQEVPVNTPVSADTIPRRDLDNFNAFHYPELHASGVKVKLENNKVKQMDKTGTNSPRVDLVRRHLLKTLAETNSLAGGELGSYIGMPSTPSSERKSRHSTPAATPSSVKRNSRRSSPARTPSTPEVMNRSVTKPLCLATTKAGQPCKIACMEGSGFCFKHQPE